LTIKTPENDLGQVPGAKRGFDCGYGGLDDQRLPFYNQEGEEQQYPQWYEQQESKKKAAIFTLL
jgi:hypothetical protein